MEEADWNFPDGRYLSYVLAAPREGREPLFIVLNGADQAVNITFPQWPGVAHWDCLVDTASDQLAGRHAPGATWSAQARCVLAFAGQP
jgi:glycogen operon protein